MSTAAAAARPAAASADGELTHRQILTVLGGLMLGMFLAALDQTVVSTAIRTIADDLSGLSLQAWATTAFLITSTITTPLYGKLSDIFGRKPLFMTAISIFLIGSVACTLAWSMYSLAAFRALQGLGAGGLMSLALTILGDIVPPRERARYQGFFLAVFGTSSVIGPVVGGLLSGVDTIAGIDGWRWIFLVNVPIGLIALVVVQRMLNIPHVPRKARIDWPGAIALALCLVPLLIVAEQGREWGWDSTNSIVCYVIGGIGLLLFLLAERAYGDDALLPLRLFRTGVFSLSSVINLMIGMAMFGGIALLPQFLQIVHGATPIEAGFMMLPLVGGIMVASVLSGQLTSRTGRYKIFPVIGTALITVAMVLLWLTVTPEIPLPQLFATMAVLGLGLGLCMQTLVLAVQNAMPARDMGVTTSAVTFFRQMGGTLGTAVFLSVVFSTAGDRIGEALRSAMGTAGFQAAVTDPAVLADPANRQVVEGLQTGAINSSVLSDSSFLQQIDPRLAAPFQEGFTSSMTLAFLIAAVVIAAAFVLVLFVKELPLRTMSGAQAARAEAQASASASLPTGDATTAAPVPAPAGRGAGVEPGRAIDAPPTTPIPVIGRADGSRNGTPQPDGAAHPAPATGQPAAAPVAPPAPAAAPPARGGGPAVTGRVQHGSGDALTGAVVTVARLSGDQVGRTTTDDDGHYRIALDGPGRYLVVAASGALPPHAATVSVGTEPVRHDVRLAGGSGIHGTVQDAAGHGAAGVTVSLIDAGGDVAASGRSGEAGRYALTGVPSGRYTLTAVGEGVDPVAVGVEVPATGSALQDLRLPQRSRLTGRVTAAPDGLPVGQALATLIDSEGAVVGSRLSGPDGTFTFEGLAAGSYTLATSGYPPVATVVALEPGRVTHSDVEFPHPLDEPGPVPSPNGNGRHVREGDPR
ncbi:multidrug transporter, MFS superfamily [Pseudonocardia sp. Ae168_Ps1]|uniref:MFS transporter n=1 Tax=unclassified Pseudonocardia TaxID=2619320 RepID=UPI00094B44C6|nr:MULTISPECIES: MFS transporter [unclassified Pseudonocardia]OLL75146.1 multidrug transporter, MFS superfamily [Pseudonocardia sp. Ae150A_Ps1]OLL81140.1 multidrug transporter, MFS superfamily [Pseudonocardia sp. Ae168_Ps1]OLL84745.1 multidrug transporter, MFS superfamily [Pseudonocardia sp. Ae263_Ps1]OLL95238.1 multidrug transporter, MFS superfamily [Pseudonocardia sp. Ae356_Ps1]